MAQTERKPEKVGPNGMTEIDTVKVRAQLTKILDDPLFRDTTRLKRFLKYITEETLEGRADRIKGYNIGLEVFDRQADFDPQADTIVRVQAGQLRRRLELYYAGSGSEDDIRLAVPKGRYAPTFEFRYKPDPDDDMSALAKKGGTGGPQDMIALISDQEPFETRIGLAVASFTDLTPAGSPDYFVEGLSAELVSALVQFRHLRVISMGALKSGSGAQSIKEIGDRNNACYVLSGSVRMSGDTFRVSVSLTDSKTGQIIYSSNYDRAYTPDNLFEIEESIASNVAAAVAAPLGQIIRHGRRRKQGRRQSLPAYEAVLKYYRMSLRPSRPFASSLLKEIGTITESSPEFSTGFAIRAMLHIFLVTQISPSENIEKNLNAADSLSRRAIGLDRENATAYFSRFQALYHLGALDEAWDMARRAVSLNPNDYSIMIYLATAHVYRNEFEASQTCYERAVSMISNPPLWFEHSRLFRAFADAKYEQVDNELQVLEWSDGLGLVLLKLAALGHLGKVQDGLILFGKVGGKRPDIIREWVRTYALWHPLPELVNPIFEGWKKLGLTVPEADLTGR